jgi:hypothetical protein
MVARMTCSWRAIPYFASETNYERSSQTAITAPTRTPAIGRDLPLVVAMRDRMVRGLAWRWRLIVMLAAFLASAQAFNVAMPNSGAPRVLFNPRGATFW